ncbi:MAG: hypothetical protein JW839_15775 [Candidatus Lokiarchaeota archaeon]|nr:hypothetical protein [Candidatus Lokiarchaeota archaeon]
MLQVPFPTYHFEHLPAYINTFVWIGFNVACLVLSILFHARTRRRPFLLLSVSFLLLVVKDAYFVLLDGSYLQYYLHVELGMDIAQAMLILIFAWSLPSFVMAVFAAILLLIALVQFYKEHKGE